MTRIRHGERDWAIHDDEWPRWVRLGWIPPDAMVLSNRWTKGVWRRADTLEVYHLFRPTPKEELAPPPIREEGVRRHGPFGLFRGPGPSVTELLILANTLVALVLYWQWGDDYSERLWAYSAGLRSVLESGGVGVLMIPVFLHADLAHLTGNMLTFFFAGAVVEEFWGRFRMLAIYLASGLTGALLSLLREKDVLSVGASGAIMGMYGAGLVFLLRERKHFNSRQRYRLWRVQIPFFVLMVIPAILHADFYAHLGGFLGGAALAAVLPPLTSRLPRPGHLPPTPDDAGPIAEEPRPGVDAPPVGYAFPPGHPRPDGSNERRAAGPIETVPSAGPPTGSMGEHAASPSTSRSTDRAPESLPDPAPEPGPAPAAGSRPDPASEASPTPTAPRAPEGRPERSD